jgi:pimeloyl-ACP methyl ester carboxylesterase
MSEPEGGREPADHRVPIAGGSLYYRTQSQGPPLILVGGGPSNADTLSELAAALGGEYTVVSYDRRGYSRSHLDDAAAPVTIGQHAEDVQRIWNDLDGGPAVVFGSSIGAVIALELAARDPDGVARLVVHEPPLGQFLSGPERAAFDGDDDGGGGSGGSGVSADAVVTAAAAGLGVRRKTGGAAVRGGAGSRARAGDIELFVRRDMPAVGRYHLDLGRLAALEGRVVVAAGRDSQGFYPRLCAERLAGALGVPLAELPGHHAGMIQYPVEFAGELKALLGA